MDLNSTLEDVLRDLIELKYHAAFYHWNVRGCCFSQDHAFFGEVESSVDSFIDRIAEGIRTTGMPVPTSVLKIVVKDSNSKADKMYETLSDLNELVYINLLKAYKQSEDATELGISNMLQDCIEYNRKLHWMLIARSGNGDE